MATMDEPMDVDLSFLENKGVDEVDDTQEHYDVNAFAVGLNHIVEPRYENKAGTFTTGIDIFSKEEQQKMSERAKRFGLSKTNNSIHEQEEDLYSSMGIHEDTDSAKLIRLNVLHMRGTENMSTKDVFEYFKDYQPASIEWINDMSCNVVWLDRITAARALLGLSKKIVGLGTKTINETQSDAVINDKNKDECDDENMSQVSKDEKNQQSDMISLKTIDFPLPPGVWRRGDNCAKSKTILLRFATIHDKKQQNSEKMSEYYKRYGNPNFGGMKGILTEKRKRTYRDVRSKKRPISDDENDTDKKRMKNPWGALSESWGTNDSVEDDFIPKLVPQREEYVPQERGSIKERLGFKMQPREQKVPRISTITVEDSASSESSSSDNEEEWGKRNKTLRMRMHADDEEEKVQKKKLKQLTRKIQEQVSTNDLRSRLGRSRPPVAPVYRDAIQVIVTNEPEKYRAGQVVDENEDEEEEEEEAEVVEESFEVEDDEKEEGEWEETDEVEEMDGHQSLEEGEEVSSDSSSDVSEKEVQGPKGSVIKVVSRAKPRVASTVWARLNHNEENDSSSQRRDLKSNLKGDLRSRLGYNNRERSPLRIEVKNDKYAEGSNESE